MNPSDLLAWAVENREVAITLLELFAGRPSTVQLLGIVANGLFIIVGLRVWYALEMFAELKDAKCNIDDHSIDTP